MTHLEKMKKLLDEMSVMYEVVEGISIISICIDSEWVRNFDEQLELDFNIDGSFVKFDN